MTRQEQLHFCKQCSNRKFDANKGIICGITSEIADFKTSCELFNKDESVSPEPINEPLEADVISVSEIPDKVLNKLKVHQDYSYAIIGGLLAAVVSAIIWAIITVTFKYQIAYMAIGVGLLVGFSVRFFGAGIEQPFGIIGAFFSLFGCLLGNLLSQVGFAAHEESLDYFQLISILNLDIIIAIFQDTFSPVDLLFYGFAIYQGYKISFRPVHHDFLQFDVSDEALKPAFTQVRLPLAFVCLVFFSVVIYNVKQGGNGHREFFYPSGSIFSEGELVDNKEQGKWIFYNENGNLKSQGFYTNGLSDSSWNYYDGENNIISTGNFKSGLEHGIWINYYANGAIKDSGNYSAGRKDRAWITYYEDGKVYQKVNYRRDQLEGPWQQFYNDGVLQSEGLYKDDSQLGVWKTWFSSGQLNEELKFDEEGDVRIINVWNAENKQVVINGDGIYSTYYDDLKLQQKGNVKDGKRTGTWNTFYKNGQKKEEGLYKDDVYKIINSWNSEGSAEVVNGNGKYNNYFDEGLIVEAGEVEDGLRTGDWEIFYPESGNIMSNIIYINDKLEGEVINFYESGAIYSVGQMKNHQKEGTWIWYFENGMNQSSVNFKDGKKEGVQEFFDESGIKTKEENYIKGLFVDETINFL